MLMVLNKCSVYATCMMLRLSVYRYLPSSVTLRIVAKRCVLEQVTIDSL